MMLLWGSTRSMQPVSDHINLLSLQFGEIDIELRFKGLVQILKASPSMVTYGEFIRNKRLCQIVINMLKFFGEKTDNILLHYDFVSKGYLSFISLYLGLINGNFTKVEEKIDLLDNVYSHLEKNSVSRLPYMSIQELIVFDNQVRRVLKEMVSAHRSSSYSASLDNYIIDSTFNQLLFSDDQLRQVIYDSWMERHYRQICNEADSTLRLYASITDDIEKALWTYAETERIDFISISISQPTASETTDAIMFFFNFLNTVIENVTNRGNDHRQDKETRMIEDEIFRYFWQVMDKRDSVWIVPSYVLKEISNLM